jgi:hypothetical protein
VAALMAMVGAMLTLPVHEVSALIIGGAGNSPIADPGWPRGAAAIFNNPARIAWWEGPPFGGGQWHAECRGDARAFNAFLAEFSRMDVRKKRVFVHDGVGHSFWLNMNREPAKQEQSRMDWVFMVWQPANWEHLRKLPAGLNPTDPRDADAGPPSRIDVYTGGNLRWSEVVVPEGLEVVDERLEAHGFTTADGVVMEGRVIDLAKNQPIAARMQLQRIEPQPKGGYRHVVVAEVPADAQGRWVLRKTPAGWHRAVVEADSFAPRVVGYVQFEEPIGWYSYDRGLSRITSVSGRVTDDEGRPLADVDVRLDDMTSADGGLYESPDSLTFQTDADGRFRSDRVPVGRATIWLHKSGYTRPGLGLPITTPAHDVAMTMSPAARVRITVDFTGVDRPKGYVVHMEPEGGAAVGKWSGSGNIDAQGQITYQNVPPGRYIVRGRPNPSGDDEQIDPITVDLKGGQTIEVTIKAK